MTDERILLGDRDIDETLERLLDKQVKAYPGLRGWSEGDPLIAPKGATLDCITDEDYTKAALHFSNYAWNRTNPKYELKEYPLTYATMGAKHIVRDRRYRQIKYAAELTAERNAPLVLMTRDFKVFRARNIWSLLWLYLKTKFFKKAK